MAVIQNPKYDNDYVTLGYLKSSMETNTTETDKKINEIPKNYNSPPVPPYYQNSLLLLNGQIYKCIKSRLVGSFNMSDWKIVIETNDLDEALKTIYDVNKLEYVDQEDGLIETFYQESDPSLNWETDLAKNLHASDLWTTDMVNCYQYEKKKTNPISFGWKKVSVPISLFDIVDGYRRIFTVKPDNYSKDDLWIDKKTKIAINSSEIYQENDWEERDDFIESSKIEQEEYHKIYLLPKITEINRQTKAEIKKAVDEIILSVSQTYTTKTEIEKYVDDIKTEVAEEYTTKKEFNAQISITSTQLNQIVEKTTTQGNEIDTLNQEYAKINMTSNQIVEQVANFTNDIEKIIKSSNGSNYIEISDAFEGNPIYFSFYGNIHYLYPGANIYPGANTFTRDSYLSIEYENSSTKMRLPYFDLNYTENVYDEFVIDGTKAYIIRRLNSDLQPLENEIIEELGNVSIPLKNGYNKLKMESFNLNYYIKYNVQNNYTNSFATKAEVTLSENKINAEVNTKVGNNEVIAKINLSTEKDASGSSALIQAEKIDAIGIMHFINNDKTTTINGDKISTGSIDADKIKANSISANQVTTDIITTATFKTQEINADKITGGTLDATKVNVTNLNASNITTGTISADRIDTSKINAITGTIGGWNILTNALTKQISNYTFEIRTDRPENEPSLLVWDTPNNRYNWYVRPDGYMYARSCEVDGVLHAGNGSTIGGLTMSNGILSSNRLGLDAVDGILRVFNSGGGSMILSNAARISATAGVGIYSNSNGNISAPSINLDLKACAGATAYLACMGTTSGTSEKSAVACENGILKFRSSGYCTYNGTSVFGSSSRASKKNIVDLTQEQKEEVYELLKNIPTKQYDYKKKYGKPFNYGFIIEDIEDTKLNDLLHITQADNKDIKMYSTEDLVRLELIVIQELMKKVEELKCQ